MKKTLQTKLAEAKKKQNVINNEVNALETKIANKKEAKKPKPVWETITDLPAVYKKLKVDPKKDVLKIQGFDKEENKVVENIIARIRVCKVLNEGKLPAKNERWYPIHTRKQSGAGLVFFSSNCNGDFARTSSAARLSFRDANRSNAYGRNFKDVEEGIIGL